MQRFFGSWQAKVAGAALSGGLSAVGSAMNIIIEKPPEWIGYAILIFGVASIGFGIWLVVDYYLNANPKKIWLKEAIRFIAAKKLKKKLKEIQYDEWLPITDVVIEQIRQLAFDGELKVFGSIGNDNLSRPISAGFWANNQIDIFSVLRDTEETKTAHREGNYIDPYRRLMVDKNEIKKLKWE